MSDRTELFYIRAMSYSKTYHKRPFKKKTKNWFSRPSIAREHSAILSTFISVNNMLLTSVQLQVYNSMINREKINRI